MAAPPALCSPSAQGRKILSPDVFISGITSTDISVHEKKKNEEELGFTEENFPSVRT